MIYTKLPKKKKLSRTNENIIVGLSLTEKEEETERARTRKKAKKVLEELSEEYKKSA